MKKIEVEFPTGVFRELPGWTGAFPASDAEGAWPKGSRVRKIVSETGDHHTVGSLATILGSLRETDGERRIMYWLEWDATPRHAVACIAWKLEPLAT